MSEKLFAADLPDWSEEDDLPEEELSDFEPRHPPVALRSVTRALTQNWQNLDRADTLVPDEEHYLTGINTFLQSPDSTPSPPSQEDNPDLELLSAIWQMVTERMTQRLHALTEAHQQLAAELARLGR